MANIESRSFQFINRRIIKPLLETLIEKLIVPHTLGKANELLLPQLGSPSQQSPIEDTSNAEAFETYSTHWHEFVDILTSGTTLEIINPNDPSSHIKAQLQHYSTPGAFLSAFDIHAQNSIIKLEDIISADPNNITRRGLGLMVNEYKTVLAINNLIRNANAPPQKG